jgi:hypothetical protein
MEELLGIIGRLYVDMYNTQKYIESLQKQLKDKDTEISVLKNKLIPKDKIEVNE